MVIAKSSTPHNCVASNRASDMERWAKGSVAMNDLYSASSDVIMNMGERSDGSLARWALEVLIPLLSPELDLDFPIRRFCFPSTLPHRSYESYHNRI